MTNWTMNAVSVAEPSVWNQFVSRGTLRKRKYLIAPTSPDRSSSQSSGIITSSASRWCAFGFAAAISGSSRHDGIEVLLGAVDVDARVGGAYFTITASAPVPSTSATL